MSESKVIFDQAKHDELFKTAHALAVTHNLLTQGIFVGNGYKDLAVAIPFITQMHEAVMKDLEPLMAAKEQSEAATPVVETAESLTAVG